MELFMKTRTELRNLEESELIHEILKLQKIIDDMQINEAVTSQIHNYHFASNEILKLNKEDASSILSSLLD